MAIAVGGCRAQVPRRSRNRERRRPLTFTLKRAPTSCKSAGLLRTEPLPNDDRGQDDCRNHEVREHHAFARPESSEDGDRSSKKGAPDPRLDVPVDGLLEPRIVPWLHHQRLPVLVASCRAVRRPAGAPRWDSRAGSRPVSRRRILLAPNLESRARPSEGERRFGCGGRGHLVPGFGDSAAFAATTTSRALGDGCLSTSPLSLCGTSRPLLDVRLANRAEEVDVPRTRPRPVLSSQVRAVRRGEGWGPG